MYLCVYKCIQTFPEFGSNPGFYQIAIKAAIMARQTGILVLTGTLGNITFYKMRGQFYARNKSSLQRERVKTDPAFNRTMQYADRMALASRTASQLYRSLPREQQVLTLYRKMTSKAMELLKKGVAASMLLHALTAAFSLLPQATDKGVVTQQGKLAWNEPSAKDVLNSHDLHLDPGIIKKIPSFSMYRSVG
jgi:hypothetical protein